MSTTVSPPVTSAAGGAPRPTAPNRSRGTSASSTSASAVKPEEVMNFSRQLCFVPARGRADPRLARASSSEENASKKMQEVLADMQRRLRAGCELRRRDRRRTPRCSPATTSRSSARPSSPASSTTRSSSSPTYLEREVAARRELKSSLTYPTIVFFLAIAAVIIMSVVRAAEVQVLLLQARTRTCRCPPACCSASPTSSRTGGPVIFGVIAALVIVAFVVHRRQRRARPAATSCCCACPAIGELVHLIAIERFCRVLAALVHTGVPLPDAVQVVGRQHEQPRVPDEARDRCARR